MWRSFFYAIGIGLFLVGAEGLFLDSVVVQKNGKIQKLVARILSDDAAKSSQPAPQAVSPNSRQFATQSLESRNRPAFANNSGSRFGPSRFSGPAYGNYGGARLNSYNNSSPQIGSSTNAQLAAYTGSVKPEPKIDTSRFSNFAIREWMPWSLLALGAIIFLYTHSTGRNHGE